MKLKDYRDYENPRDFVVGFTGMLIFEFDAFNLGLH